MTVIVLVLVYLAIGLCVGLWVYRDALLGWERAPSPANWAILAVIGVPLLAIATAFWLFDAITGRR